MNILYRKTGRKAILSNYFLAFAQKLFYRKKNIYINVDALTILKENRTHFIDVTPKENCSFQFKDKREEIREMVSFLCGKFSFAEGLPTFGK